MKHHGKFNALAALESFIYYQNQIWPVIQSETFE